MIIKSKFNSWTYWMIIPILLYGFMTFVLFKSLINKLTLGDSKNLNFIVTFLIITLTFFLYLFLVELRIKMTKVYLLDDRIKLIRFAGLLNTKTILFEEINGYKYSSYTTKQGVSRVIVLITKNKKRITIVDSYWKNSNEIINNIKTRFIDLGYINLNGLTIAKYVF